MHTTSKEYTNQTISIIAALSQKNSVIGKDNTLPWHIPEDLLRFRRITVGHPVIMGRKTYESIGKPLPNRTNIIITRNKALQIPGCIITTSLEEAIQYARKIEKKEIFIIGGGEIFKKGIKMADKLYLTLVEGDFKGNIFFPDYSTFKTILSKEQSTSNGHAYTFIELTK